MDAEWWQEGAEAPHVALLRYLAPLSCSGAVFTGVRLATNGGPDLWTTFCFYSPRFASSLLSSLVLTGSKREGDEASPAAALSENLLS